MKRKLAALSAMLGLFYAVTGFAGVDEAKSSFDTGNYAEAQKEAQPLADQGNAAAQNLIGRMYIDGKGVPEDYKKALDWFNKAAEQGNAEAQSRLGDMYSLGKGVPVDYKKALDWFNKAAEQGNAEAQSRLGDMYNLGNGVPHDFTKTIGWYRKAAEQGNAYAQFNLGSMYENALGVKQNYAQAIEWYRKAAAQRFAGSQDRLNILEERLKTQQTAKDKAQVEKSAGTKYGEDDWYYISSAEELSAEELTGPDGLRMSCRDIAVFVSSESGIESAEYILYRQDGSHSKKQAFTPDEGRFNVNFINWTPAIAEYLQNAVDSCVTERHIIGDYFHSLVTFENVRGDSSSIRIYPLRAKKLLADVSVTALATRKYYADEQERNRLLELESEKQKEEYKKTCSQPHTKCYCINLGVLYSILAQARDNGESPQFWFKTFGAHFSELFSEKRVKKMINQVYFEPGFINAGGDRLNYQMRDNCLGNTFKPLK